MMEDIKGKNLENATVYYASEKKDEKAFDVIKFIHYKKNNTWYKNTHNDPETKAILEEIKGIPDEETRKKLNQLDISFEPNPNAAAFLSYLSNEAETMLASDDDDSPKKKDAIPVPPPAPATNGIAAGSTLVAPSAAKNTYNIHALIDKCRAEINAKLKPQNYSLSDGKYELVGKDGHKITIEANGNMAADLAPISSKNEADFAKFICDDLKAMVDMYMAMHTKLGDAAFPENKINLFVLQKNIKSDEDKIKMAKIEKLVAQEMNTYLSKPEYATIKDKFTVLGQPVKKPDPAQAPKPSAPPLSEENARKTAENSDTKLPGIITINHPKITVDVYKQNLAKEAKGTAPEKSALIFPGNDGHATENNIHGKKSGSGLAQAADELGKAGIGTLSLPTTFGGTSNATADSVNALVKSEMAKLWEAVGEGYQLVLPVRPPNPKNFFSPENRQAIQNITGESNLEPSFWGNIQSDFANNTNHLPSYYCNELRDLQKFILDWNKADANKKQLLADLEKQKPDFHKAFIQGFGKNPENAPKTAPDASAPDSLRMGPTPAAPPASPRPK